MDYLNNNRIIYRRDPVTDEPSDVFEWGKFYKDGTRMKIYNEITTIFNDITGLTRSEKLSIVGKLIGRSKIATKENIYECMNAIHDMHECITVQAIARMLGCSTRTVYRNLDNQLKTEKNLLNSMI